MYVVIVTELVDANNIINVTFPEPNSDFSVDSSIFIPGSYIQQQSITASKLSS